MPNLTYVLRMMRTVAIERATEMQTMFHFDTDSGFSKLGVCPGGGESAGLRWEGELIAKEHGGKRRTRVVRLNV